MFDLIPKLIIASIVAIILGLWVGSNFGNKDIGNLFSRDEVVVSQESDYNKGYKDAVKEMRKLIECKRDPNPSIEKCLDVFLSEDYDRLPTVETKLSIPKCDKLVRIQLGLDGDEKFRCETEGGVYEFWYDVNKVVVK
jgi:hypothetical protein